MIVTIHQPDFAPWLGFFDRWRRSDLYIVLDDVQFIRRGWQHRDRIKTAQGEAWLTLPVEKKGKYDQLVSEVRMDNGQDWRARHLRAIGMAYGRAPHFPEVFPAMESIYAAGHELMMDFNLALLDFMACRFKAVAPRRMASSYAVKTVKTQRLVDLVKAAGGDAYLCGTGSRDYLDEGLFSEAGISVIWQEYAHPVYSQLYGEFIPRLSGIDPLMMCGAYPGEDAPAQKASASFSERGNPC